MKKYIISVLCFGLVMPLHGGQAPSSWWKTYLPTLSMPSMPSWMGMPTAETSAQIKDALRFGLLGALPALSTMAALVAVIKTYPGLDVNTIMGMSFLGGMAATGLSIYLLSGGNSKFEQLKKDVGRLIDFDVQNAQYEELQASSTEIGRLLQSLQEYKKKTRLTEEMIWVQKTKKTLETKLEAIVDRMASMNELGAIILRSAKKLQDNYQKQKAEKNEEASLIYDAVKADNWLRIQIGYTLSEMVKNELEEIRLYFETELEKMKQVFADDNQKNSVVAVVKILLNMEDTFSTIRPIPNLRPFDEEKMQSFVVSATADQGEIQRLMKTVGSETKAYKIMQEWLTKVNNIVSVATKLIEGTPPARVQVDEAPPARVQTMPIKTAIEVLQEGLDLLGQPDLSKEAINAAYRKLSSKYHPDKRPTGDAEKFTEVNNAKDFLMKYFEQWSKQIQQEYSNIRAGKEQEKRLQEGEVEQPMLQLEWR